MEKNESKIYRESEDEREWNDWIQMA